MAGCPISGQAVLFDGRTGEAFDQHGHRGRHVHAQAPPPGRRQDPRAHHRPVLARHPAAAGRQGAVRRSAPRRDGSLGDGSLRRGLRAAGVPDRQVRRRAGPHPHVRGDRQGRAHARGRPAGDLQRADQGAPGALPRTSSSIEDPASRASARRHRVPAGLPRWHARSPTRSAAADVSTTVRSSRRQESP